jgi:hypothetical protein
MLAEEAEHFIAGRLVDPMDPEPDGVIDDDTARSKLILHPDKLARRQLLVNASNIHQRPRVCRRRCQRRCSGR